MTRKEELETEFAKKMAQAEIEDAIAAFIPSNLPSPRIFGYPLYGTVASVAFGDGYGRNFVTWEQACEIVKALPPVSATLVRNGSLSIRARAHVESLSEESKERWEAETDISSVQFKIHGRERHIELEWFAKVGESLVRVSVYPGGFLSSGLGSYSAKRVEFRGGFRYEKASFKLDPKLYTILDDGGPLAQYESPIRWWTSEESPGDFTGYFVDLGCDLDPAKVGLTIVQRLTEAAHVKP